MATNTEPTLVRKLPQPIKYMLPGKDGAQSLTHFEQVANWAASEISIWNKLVSYAQSNAASIGNPSAAVVAKSLASIKDHWSNVASSAATGIAAPNETGAQNASSSIQSLIGAISNGSIPSVNSEYGKRVAALSDTDSLAAIGLALLIYPGPNFVLQSRAYGPEMAFFVLAKGLLTYREPSTIQERASLDQLRGEWASYFANATEAVRSDRERIERWQRRAAAVELARGKKHRDMFNKHKEEIATYEELLRTQMSLKAPAKYWSDKAWNNALGAGAALGSVCLIVAVGIFGVINWGFPWVKEAIANTAGDKFNVELLVALTIPAVAVYYVLRLLSKTFTHNLSYMGDASLRATAVTSFLAMSADTNKPFNDAERFLALQAVFRAGPGEPQEAEVPPSAILEILSRNAQK